MEDGEKNGGGIFVGGDFVMWLWVWVLWIFEWIIVARNVVFFGTFRGGISLERWGKWRGVEVDFCLRSYFISIFL